MKDIKIKELWDNLDLRPLSKHDLTCWSTVFVALSRGYADAGTLCLLEKTARELSERHDAVVAAENLMELSDKLLEILVPEDKDNKDPMPRMKSSPNIKVTDHP